MEIEWKVHLFIYEIMLITRGHWGVIMNYMNNCITFSKLLCRGFVYKRCRHGKVWEFVTIHSFALETPQNPRQSERGFKTPIFQWYHLRMSPESKWKMNFKFPLEFFFDKFKCNGIKNSLPPKCLSKPLRICQKLITERKWNSNM